MNRGDEEEVSVGERRVDVVYMCVRLILFS